MEKTALDARLTRYTFPPPPGKHFPLNIYVLTDEAEMRGLLIDTGFEPQAAAVAEDLARAGYAVSDVILSHVHDDHFEGLKALPPVCLHASPRSQAAIDEHFGPEERALYTPDDPLCDGSALAFGASKLRFVEAPGHSPCSVLTVIDERFVHVGDLLMASAEGVPILPYVAWDDVATHIRSLERLCVAFAGATLLLGHGPEIHGEEEIAAAIEHRLCYLRAVARGGGRATYAEAMRDCRGEFLHTEWHATAPDVVA